MRDDGEPISGGQLDRRAADGRALRNTLVGVVLFTGVVLVNGILAILLIELLQAIGSWEIPTSDGAPPATSELRGRMRIHATDPG